MSSSSTLSTSTITALEHLKKMKPYDGWSAELKNTNGPLVRLTRRNVPITDSYFIDIYYDENTTKSIVGILTPLSKDGTAQGQILIDTNGKPVTNHVTITTVSSWKPSSGSGGGRSSSNATARGESSSSSSSSWQQQRHPTGTTTTTEPMLTAEQNQQIMYFFACIVGGSIVLRILSNVFIGIYVLALPAIYIYMITVCPMPSSFDAKKELKRVLRGHNLPDDHPNKPKGFLEETLARFTASVATELATFPGYEIITTPIFGAAIINCVRVPTANMDYYWIGAFSKWYYIYSKEINSTAVPTTNNTYPSSTSAPIRPNIRRI